MSNQLYQKIYDMLSPNVGATMAKATLEVQCKKVGATPETLSKSHLPQLAEKVTVALKIFVGSEKAVAIGHQIAELT
jgi:hypothetical protein